MGLLSWSPCHCYRLCCDGCFWQLTHHLPSLDNFHCIPTLPILPGTGLRSGLYFWLVIDFGRHMDSEVSFCLFLMISRVFNNITIASRHSVPLATWWYVYLVWVIHEYPIFSIYVIKAHFDIWCWSMASVISFGDRSCTEKFLVADLIDPWLTSAILWSGRI